MRVEQFGGDPQLPTAAPHPPVQHVADPKLSADLSRIHRNARIALRRALREHEDLSQSGEYVDDAFDDPFGEIILRGLGLELMEGHHRDRRAAIVQ